MPNGKPGDSPVTDIVHYGREVFSPETNQLVREIDSFTADYGTYDPFRSVEDLLWAAESDRTRETELREALKRLLAELKRR
jgi:hypothetical protein